MIIRITSILLVNREPVITTKELFLGLARLLIKMSADSSHF